MRAAQYEAIRLQEQLEKLSDAELADQARALLLQVNVTGAGRYSADGRKLHAMQVEAKRRLGRLNCSSQAIQEKP